MLVSQEQVSTLPGALSRDAAAKYLSCSVRFLDSEARAGRIRKAKLGARTVFLRQELDRYLTERLEPAAAVS